MKDVDGRRLGIESIQTFNSLIRGECRAEQSIRRNAVSRGWENGSEGFLAERDSGRVIKRLI